MDLALIPTPRSLVAGTGMLDLGRGLRIVVESDDAEDAFAAQYLGECLRDEHGLAATIGGESTQAATITLRRGSGPAEGYRLDITSDGILIVGNDAAGVYYATQTLRQCLRTSPTAPQLACLSISDHPALTWRAMHYDTKHHQDTRAYVESFIRELALYKANILVWEWEDKLAYRCHPEVGAPGAFSIEVMQELTAYARQHHIEIVPLVQGLGHVPFILKHKKFRHLREIPDSDWEFCPLKDGSYDLLFTLWKDAMEATPGSRFFHIGSDETYELGEGVACGCAAHAAEHGTDSLMRIFIDRCTEWVEAQGRTCLSWGGQWKPGTKFPPRPSMIWTDGDKPEVVKASADAGYPCWIYAPNTGVTPLVVFCLPWVKGSMWHQSAGTPWQGGFHSTSTAIRTAALNGSVKGSITTSWDDSGLHNQTWMPHFICACEYSWNPEGDDLDAWTDRYFRNYFGNAAQSMRECHTLLQDAALFYDDTFQRRVWHWGDIGKVHLPDLPREGLEHDLFWRKRYAKMVYTAREQRQKLERAISILERNRANSGVRHRYDLEVLISCARLMLHNVDLILALNQLETLIDRASYTEHFKDRKAALATLRSAETLVADQIAERERVYADLVTCWEQTRLPKGYSTPGHPYFFKRERARHFANRTPDLRYLVMDEDLLDLEGYLVKLRNYNDRYAATKLDV